MIILHVADQEIVLTLDQFCVFDPAKLCAFSGVYTKTLQRFRVFTRERSAWTDMQSTCAVLLNFGSAITLSYPGPVSAVNTTAPIISLLSSSAVDKRVGWPSDRRFGLQRVHRERLQRSSFFCGPPVKNSKSWACGLHPENSGTYSHEGTTRGWS